jgi:hypothetical protein
MKREVIQIYIVIVRFYGQVLIMSFENSKFQKILKSNKFSIVCFFAIISYQFVEVIFMFIVVEFFTIIILFLLNVQ